MKTGLNEQVKEYGRRHRLKGRWGKVVTTLACMVIFCTTYALILPAITADRETVCGLEEHTHTAECYAQELICTDESEEHTHSEGCYKHVLTCALEEHQHSDACYPQEEAEATAEPVAETETATEAPAEAPTAEPDATEVPTETPEATEEAAADAEPTEVPEEVVEEPEIVGQTVRAEVYADESYGSSWSGSVNIALQGNLPEGVAVKAYPVYPDLGEEVDIVEAYDIGLFVPVTDEITGETTEVEYEPESTVQVKISSGRLNELAAVDVYHITDGGSVEKVQSNAAVSDGTVKFNAREFSAYVLTAAETAEDEEQVEDDLVLADVTQNGTSFTMAVGDTLTVNDYSNLSHTYVESYTSGRRTYTSSSSNTSVATLSISNGTATITAVGAGTTTVTLQYEYTSYWSKNHSSVALTITVQGEFNDTYSGNAALYFLSDPKGDPIDNSTGSWLPDAGQSSMLGKISVNGAKWENGNDAYGNVIPNKNITSHPANYITSWPDGSTGSTWVVTSTGASSSYFNTILNWVWDNYKSSIQSELGVTLEKSDITQITLTPRKISRDNGSTYPYHIDCSLSLTSSKVYMAKFWVLEPNGYAYTQVAAKNYKSNTDVKNAEGESYYSYTYKVGDKKEVNGITYVLTGWYTENSDGDARSDTKASFDYKPTETELKDGVVNFYAEWVPATKDLTIVKYEKGTEYTALAGAVFTLSQDGKVIKTSDATDAVNGETTIRDIPYGTYTLSETTAPDNYKGVEGFTVTVGDTITINAGNSGAEMKEAKLYVPNEKATVDVTIKKVDNNGNPLDGAEFYLYYQDGDKKLYYNDGTWSSESKSTIAPSGDDASTTVSGLVIGTTYYLVETKAPNGYMPLTKEVTINPTSASALTVSNATSDGLTVTVTNQTGATLPNTGGAGTAMYTLSGLAFAAIALLGCKMYSGKQRRKGGVR